MYLKIEKEPNKNNNMQTRKVKLDQKIMNVWIRSSETTNPDIHVGSGERFRIMIVV